MNNTITKDVAKALTELVSINAAESFPRYQTPFVDYVRIKCKGGHGGSPLPNVNRSRRLNGPGYGGHGGDVILRSTHLSDNLLHLEHLIKAKNGGDASGTSRGVIVRKRVKTDEGTRAIFWHQFMETDDKLLVARGGKGGIGPSCFKKHDNRLAEVGETTNLELELRLLNDVAFIGLPNSGKTSLLSSLTSYMTRIGPEEGSTTRPHVAVIKFVDGLDIRVLDLPPLSLDSAKDNNSILRHIYRSKLLLYVLSGADNVDHLDILLQLRNIVRESPMFTKEKLEIVVMTKCDLLYKDVLYNLDKLYFKLLDMMPNIHVVGISATHRLGLQNLVDRIRSLLYPTQIEYTKRTIVPSVEIKQISNGGPNNLLQQNV
ncbi:bifunctional GTP binding domain/OBG-type GTPase/P-loop containing nucleoside triphosphate hydrolase/GTP1-OBG domain superfamily/GTP1-OBG domain [Babesia duncani]|uniref:Bifunctional GTP binding domain/OBG-type GTPase/P-loop containing nucleoside triphosphate hydrolase/GTP1-OBG domain superfamily/GTP1-OBG domain n=1 Tax=Babesia duncani TaxID=323732 RepID=A0AAD9UPB2_9APIC|nr:bifunctional GTP binding domain/OBG-type GTPase/P-loop containing nucleoside triphosphate hydrolase/GTP1-OBG domain superfamily/GTP1-OBG domain [Babesia duncani]